MKPITRIDMYLAVISGDEDAVTPLPEPITRIDMYLASLAGINVVELPEPITRIDYYLAALCGMNVTIPDEPITRIDFYLAVLNGQAVDTPEAITRIDHYLDAWAEGGSLPWQTFVGNPLQFNAPKAHVLKSVKVEFSPKQDLHGYTNPWPAGGGANKCDLEAWLTSAGVPYQIDANGWAIFSFTDATLYNYHFPITLNGNGSAIILLDTARTTATNFRLRVYQDSSIVAETAGGNPQSAKMENKTFNSIGFNWSASGTVVAKVCVVEGATIPAYSPYSNICPISGWTALDIYNEPEYDPTAQPMATLSFSTTVYGGTAEVAEDGTATGSDECGKIVLDGSADEGWEFGSGVRAYIQVDTMKRLEDYTGSMYCDKLQTVKDHNRLTTAKGISGYIKDSTYPNQNWIYVAVDGVSTVAELRTWLSANPITVVYPLATPVPFSVTASDTPTAAQGINTIWSDANGDVTVEAQAEAVNLSALQSLNMLLGGRYVNNHTANDLTDEEALDILLGRNTK